MMNSTSVSRAALLVTGTVVGAYCAGTAYMNGAASAPGLAGIALGAAGAAVACGSWFLLPEAKQLAQEGSKLAAKVVSLGWLMCTLFVLWNAVGFTAFHRTEKVGNASQKIAAYDRADAQLQSASADLEEQRKNKRWASTNGCTNATVAESVTFCNQVASTKSNISTAQYVLKEGRPGTSDPQGEIISFALGNIGPALVGKLTPLIWALTQELAMSLFFYIALRPRKAAASPAAVIVSEPAVKAADLSPLLSLIKVAQREIATAQENFDRANELYQFHHYQSLMQDAWECFVEAEDAPAAVVEAAPAVVVRKAERKTATPIKVVAVGKRVRDNVGRFTKKAKLVSVTPKAVPLEKPKLGNLLLGSGENVVRFDGTKKD